MIGHTKCAAGAAGMAKIALALHHKVLPPTLHVEKPNPKARFEESPFFVNRDLLPWIQANEEVPRRAGVSSFGFGGTNFHAVVEEYVDAVPWERAPLLEKRRPELLLVRAPFRNDSYVTPCGAELEIQPRLIELQLQPARWPRIA